MLGRSNDITRRGSRSGGSAAAAMAAVVAIAAATLWANPLAVAGAGDDHAVNMDLIASVDDGSFGDIAFWGDTAVVSAGVGTADPYDDGFVLFDIAEPARPSRAGRFRCAGAYRDVSVWEDLVVLSVQDPFSGPACDAPAARPMSPDAFNGLRIVSIADRDNPVQVAAVQTNDCVLPRRGSHTNTVLPDLDHRGPNGQPAPRLVVYANGVCQTVVEVPLANPQAARAVSHIATWPAPGCHDLTVFLPRQLGVCAGGPPSTQLWDITDPIRPIVLSNIVNPMFQNHHGGAFSWDGKTLVLSDENVDGSASTPDSCGRNSIAPLGALWFYDVTDPRAPVLRSHFTLPPRATGYCSSHYFNVVPLQSGRDVLVGAWYDAGTTVVDFTDPGRPVEIASFLAATGTPLRSSAYSSYWYNGHVYVTNTTLPLAAPTSRGLDVLSVDRAVLGETWSLPHLNASTQLAPR